MGNNEAYYETDTGKMGNNEAYYETDIDKMGNCMQSQRRGYIQN